MLVKEALKETGKAIGSGWDATYVKSKGGVLTQYVINGDDDMGAVDLNAIFDVNWQPYHEVKEIRPEKAGELWEHKSGLYGHTFEHPSGDIYFTNKDETRHVKEAKAVIHNKNGWTRRFPKVEDDSVERIEIEGVSFWGCTNSAGVHIMAESTEALYKLIREPSNRKMKMILEIPKDKP